MARTKKFLASTSASRSSRSFYRPLKRLNSQSVVPSANNVNIFLASRSRKITLEENAPKHAPLPPRQTIDIKPDKIRPEKENSAEKDTSYLELKYNNPPIISLDDSSPQTSQPPSKAEIEATPRNIDTDSDDFKTSDEPIDYLNHDVSENLERLELGVEKAHERDEKIAKQLKEIQDQYALEKEKMQKTIHILKKEIEHHTPLSENKFFTISKQLSDITQAMNRLLESENWIEQSQKTLQPTISANGVTLQDQTANISEQVKLISGQNNADQKADQNNQTKTTLPEENKQTISNTEKKPEEVINTSPASTPIPADKIPESSEKPEKVRRKIPKPLIAVLSTIILTGVIGGIVWYNFNKTPQVDAQLLQEYLPADAKPPEQAPQNQEEKKIDQTSLENPTPPDKSKVQGASDEKYAESQADVAYSDTLWDTFKDPTIGIEVSYPKNTVNVVKTESSLTFLRKTGYIFKIQVYETALEIDEYWKSVKATNLDYSVKETQFRDKEALFLELEDITEYPGDRYIVKNGEFIYDIWYATFSNRISDDDIKRVDIMLNSFKFL